MFVLSCLRIETCGHILSSHLFQLLLIAVHIKLLLQSRCKERIKTLLLQLARVRYLRRPKVKAVHLISLRVPLLVRLS